MWASASLPVEDRSSPPEALAVLGLFVAVAALVFTAGMWIQSAVDVGFGLMLTELVLIAAPAVVYLHWRRPVLPAANWSLPRVGTTAWTIAAAIMAIVAATALGSATRTLIGSAVAASELQQDFAPVTLVALVFSLWVLAPVCEELLFRVVIQRGLATAMPSSVAVVGASLLFAVFHGALERVPETLLLGLFLGILYARTGSYVLVVAFHATCNVFGPPLFLVFFDVAPARLLVIAAVMVLTAAVLLPWGERRTEPRPALSRWALAMLAALVLKGLVIEVALHEPAARASLSDSAFPRAGACVQEWRVEAGNMLRVTERLTLPTGAMPPAQLAPLAPGASLDAVELDGAPLYYDGGPTGWSLNAATARPGRCLEVRWHLPLSSLSEHDGIRWVNTQAAAPVAGFELKLKVEPDSGFRLANQPGASTTPLTINVDPRSPRQQFGSCGLRLEPSPARPPGGMP